MRRHQINQVVRVTVYKRATVKKKKQHASIDKRIDRLRDVWTVWTVWKVSQLELVLEPPPYTP